MLGWHVPIIRLASFSLLAGSVSVLCAEHLPVYTYTTVHGLASDSVFRVFGDSRGYVWLGTRAGVTRFDGYRFINYEPARGVPSARVEDIIESRTGVYWFAAGKGGVCSWTPSDQAPSRFKCYSPEPNAYVQRTYVDHKGRLWIGTHDRLFMSEPTSSDPAFKKIPFAEHLEVLAITEDRSEAIWFGTNGRGLFRMSGDRVDAFSGAAQPLAIAALVTDRFGRVWAGTEYGLALLRSEPAAGEPVVEKIFKAGHSSHNDIQTIHEAPDGTIWFGTDEALCKLSAGVVTAYTHVNGLARNGISSISHDTYGNLWVGTDTGGVMKIASAGLVSYSEADGLATVRIYSVFEDRAGRICTIGGLRRDLFLGCLEGRRFETVRPRVPAEMNYFGWGHDRIALQDRTGAWWIATGQGLLRYPPVPNLKSLSKTPPMAVYTERDGLCGNDIFRVFEDRRGDVWVSSVLQTPGLARWDRRTGKFERYCNEFGNQTPSAIGEDSAGHVWVGLYLGGLARYDGQKFKVFRPGEAVPPGRIDSMYLDEHGRLWAANNSRGVIEIDDPTAAEPHFKMISTENGLSSNSIECITSDTAGGLYIGSDQGVDRLDLGTRRVRHFSLADGLPNTAVGMAHRDRAGNLWFASSSGGLSQLRPQAYVERWQPRVLITRVRIAGAEYPVPDFGTTSLSGLRLRPGTNNIEIGFSAVQVPPGSPIRYEYRLEGAESQWIATDQHDSVNYAGLGPGTYRFAARAIQAAGGSQQATVDFEIQPAFWRRPWFIGLVCLAAAAAGYSVHRYRLANALELQRVRIRIAGDLHDDIGASLSQIALLSEVVRRNGNGNEHATDPVARIGELSREASESMSDLVWAISPQRDTLADLTSRMRRYAKETFEANGVEVEFATGGDEDNNLMPDVKRQVYLIYKESLNNAARHAACTRVQIQFGVRAGVLELKVVDNGRGFDSLDVNRGNGLASMRRRAESLGGRFDVNSTAQSGTTVTVAIPLDRRSMVARIKAHINRWGR